MGTIEDKLDQLGLTLPQPEWPNPNRTGCVQVGSLLFVSGHGPRGLAGVVEQGKVGDQVSEEEAYQAARACAVAMLASMKDAIGDLDRVVQVVKLQGFVNAAPGWDRPFAVVDGASDLFLELWGPEHGRHARTAIGVAELPRSIPVEVEGIFELRAETG